MSSSIFSSGSPTPKNGGLEQAVAMIMNMTRGQNPQVLLKNLCSKDPQIANFVSRCQNMTPAQIAAQCGVDYDYLRSLIK